MKTDLYLRIVLTIIAVCMVWSIIEPFAIRPATAGSGIQNVNIAQVGGRHIGRELPTVTRVLK